MPLDEAYDKLIKSDIADMKNIGGRPARIDHRGAVHPALRQQASRGRISTSPAWPGARRTRRRVPKGATAFGVRLLDRLVAEHYED